LVLLFSTSSEMQRFLSMLEHLWHTKTVIIMMAMTLPTNERTNIIDQFIMFLLDTQDDVFPIGIANDNGDDCPQQHHCERLFLELSHSWDALLKAALN